MTSQVGATTAAHVRSAPSAPAVRRGPGARLALGIAVLGLVSALAWAPAGAVLGLVALVVALRSLRRRRTALAWAATGIAAVSVAGGVLLTAALVVSHLPAMHRYEQCAEQPDVSQCQNPMTSWLP